MAYDLLLGLIGFAFASTITPGPNNLMIMASGANFGVARSLPHLLGITLGFALMILLIGLGVAQVFEAFPMLKPALAGLSVVYLLWLAWRIAQAGPPEAQGSGARPLSFLQAAAFQWVNPKAWSMALTAVTLFAAGGAWAVFVVTGVFAVVAVPAIAVWMMAGVKLRAWLGAPGRLRWFNWTMAGLIVVSVGLSVVPLFWR